MTQTYQAQPEKLPDALPAGTLLRGCTASTELRLVNGLYYVNGETRYYGWAPSQVLWESVPIAAPPECAEAPRLCECCGIHAADAVIDWFAAGDPMSLNGAPYAKSCVMVRVDGVGFADRIRARRSSSTAPVGTGETDTGRKEGERVCAHAGCPSCDAAPSLCSTPACAARSVAATHGKRCVYCHGTDSRDDFETMMEMTRHPGDWEAGERLAAMARAERPRVTATSRMLALGHPVSFPSNEGDD